MKKTYYLTPTTIAAELSEVRGQAPTHTLVALLDKEGIYLYDRRTRCQHLWRWADILVAYREEAQVTQILES